jgi:hypothetical protein
MRSGYLVIFLVLLSATFCSANTLTDIFHESQNNCNYSANAPYSNCDVIGDPQLYDIQSVTFSASGNLATVMIYLNSGAVQTINNQLTLGPFSDSGLTLIPGDVFFYDPNSIYDPSNPSSAQYLKYGLALTDHDNFLAGSLYAITGGISVETAEQALNNTNSYFYRRNEAVLMTGSGAPVGSGTVSVAPYGDGTTNALYAVTATFSTTSDFLSITSGDHIGVLFSSADCGNDVIQGVAHAPEPGPAVLMLTGVGLLAAGRKWRKRVA